MSWIFIFFNVHQLKSGAKLSNRELGSYLKPELAITFKKKHKKAFVPLHLLKRNKKKMFLPNNYFCLP